MKKTLEKNDFNRSFYKERYNGIPLELIAITTGDLIKKYVMKNLITGDIFTVFSLYGYDSITQEEVLKYIDGDIEDKN